MRLDTAIDSIAARQNAQSILTRIAFFKKSNGKPVRYATAGAADQPNFELTVRRVRVGDARASGDPPTFDAQGFVLRNAPTDFSDYANRDAVKRHYLPEVKRLLLQMLGAEKVVVYNYVLLSSRPGLKSSPGADIPAFTAHNDYTATIAPMRLVDLIGASEAAAWLARRVVQVNVWRPFNNPVEEYPLAMCDGRSVLPEHLVSADLRFADRVSEFQFLKHSKRQAWWYYPHMTPDEVLFIKGWDSRPDGGAAWTPHAAIQHIDAADPRPRETIVARAFALLPHANSIPKC